MREIMGYAMINNIQIIGNCMGYTADLQKAIGEYVNGCLNITVDSVFKNNQVGDFFERTYKAKDRFGKVVYQYN